MSRNPYNEAVRRYFANPRHAGDLQARYPDRLTAEALESQAGCRVALGVELEGQILRRIRYRVFGCPHLIAAAESSACRFEGHRAEKLRDFSVAQLMRELEVPIEKTGRMLLLEDAVKRLSSAIGEVMTADRPGPDGNQ
ncbi:MAG: iron-sulfur cluster assembly scaffold protein [Woeseia sp.]